MSPLSTRAGYIGGAAEGVSADGSMVVGKVQWYSQTLAATWNNGAFSLLSGLSSSHDSVARGVSHDGTVIVGDSGFSGGTEAVFWRNGLIHRLGDLEGGGFYSVALASSLDGSVIGGRGETDLGHEAFLWTEGMGVRNLRQMLIDGGVQNLDGWRLEQVEGISANGNILVGWGYNPRGASEGWLVNLSPTAVVPEPSTLVAFASLSLTGIGIAARRRRKRQ
jgi:uncharacterized membrane protein